LRPDGGRYLQTGAEIQRLKGPEGAEHILGAYHYAVVFQHDGVDALGEYPADFFAQLDAARQVVGREAHLAAHHARVWHEKGLGQAADDGKRD